MNGACPSLGLSEWKMLESGVAARLPILTSLHLHVHALCTPVQAASAGASGSPAPSGPVVVDGSSTVISTPTPDGEEQWQLYRCVQALQGSPFVYV